MPRGDGTGPLGQGPMTGRGMGYCVVPLKKSRSPYWPKNIPGFYGYFNRRFFGRRAFPIWGLGRRGGRRAFRRRWM
jgi:hypothetical protein